jgi:hypothetical protein
MINLAALRYRRAMADVGGPIEKIELADVTIAGRRCFQANAYVREDLLPRPCRQLFSNASGTGTASSPLIARYKAISEGLERWAYHAIRTGPHRHRYGFDADPSSTGMAAFPGVLPRAARAAALAEATERFNILSWWEGHLAAVETESGQPGVGAAVIVSDAPGVAVIVFRRSPHGYYTYGHAGGADFAAARDHALAEMERHELVLRVNALVALGQGGAAAPVSDFMEQRSLFFSSEHGHELFLARLRSRATLRPKTARLAYDGPIQGPWTRYADVWRTVFVPPSEQFLSDDPTYFFW